MCHPPFKESIERVIRLPEEKTSTFEDFFIWLHAFEPCLSLNCMDSVIDLAIFAEKYHVCHLKNQTSDAIRTALSENRWKVTPETIATVYNNVPAGTILRQMCFLGFAVSCSVANWRRRSEGNNHYAKWETAFCNCPDLGWDYFQHIQTGQADTSSIGFGVDTLSISWGGACRFHDHSDVAGWVRGNCSKCPYPHGAPVEDDVGEHEKETAEEDAMPEDVVDDAVPEEAVPEDAGQEDSGQEDSGLEDAMPEDAMPEDAMPEDAVVNDAVPEDATLEGAVVDNAMPEDAVVDDAVPEDAMPEDTVVDDAVVEDV
jgi:hypothetical protein